MIHLYNQDCMEAMASMQDNSVDLVLTDPPYNIGKDSWDKWKTQESYVEWCGKWILEVQRILKDNGSFYWFHNDMEQIIMIMAWIKENTSFKYRQFITWNKYFKGCNLESFKKKILSTKKARNYFGGFTEYLLFYTFQDETGLSRILDNKNNFQGLRRYFEEYQKALGLSMNGINEKLGHRKAEHSFYWNSSQWSLPAKEVYEEIGSLPRSPDFKIREYEELRREYEELRREYEEQRYTFNVQRVDEIFSDNANNNVWVYNPAPKSFHLTPKPIDLLENIILHSSNEGDTVLDCFMGSGSTGIACNNLKRRFIGIEKNTEYFEAAKKRIQKHQQQLQLF